MTNLGCKIGCKSAWGWQIALGTSSSSGLSIPAKESGEIPIAATRCATAMATASTNGDNGDCIEPERIDATYFRHRTSSIIKTEIDIPQEYKGSLGIANPFRKS